MAADNSTRQEVKFPAVLNIGAVGLSMEELLMLRPGMTISFDRPAVFKAALEVGGIKWVLASLEIAEKEAVLKIEKVFEKEA